MNFEKVSKNVLVNRLVWKNYVFSAYVGKSNNLFYVITKVFYVGKQKYRHKMTIMQEELEGFMNEFQKLVLTPNMAIKRYNENNGEFYKK